ncbi:MAG: LPS export ABC transporter permease LptF [Gammaproteobacteria bacterium]
MARTALVIDRYLLREVILSWLVVTLVVWIILLSNKLVRYLGKAIAGEVPGQEVFALLGLSSVGFLVMLLPLSLYLAIILALGRLYKDSEITALSACGVGTGRLYRPLLSLAVVAAILLSWLSLVIAPATAMLRHQIENRAEQSTDLSLLTPGRFQEVQNGKLVIYAEQLSEDRKRITNLFMDTIQQGQSGLLTAEHAHTELDAEKTGRILVMEDGHRYQGFPGDEDFRILRFARYGVALPSAAVDVAVLARDAKPTKGLWKSKDLRDRAELHWRISAPVAILVLTLLAVPVSRTTPRQGKYGKMFIAVLIFVIYYNLLGAARFWLESGVIWPQLGLWWVHGLMVLCAAALLIWGDPQRVTNKRITTNSKAASP